MKLLNFVSKYLNMKKSPNVIINQIIPFIIFFLWLIFFISGINFVPFHPDEATQIFMSSDFDKIVSGNFNDLFYNNINGNEPKQNYRLLDSPITRYMIGLGRYITKAPTLALDWDWSGTWKENDSALPNTKLLTTSRLSIAIFLPVAIILYYFLIRKIFGFPISVLSTILLMTNSIILLHTRRAMAESGLIFFIVASLFTLLFTPKKLLFLSAIPIGLSLNIKQSLLPLFLIGIIFIIFKMKSNIKALLFQSVLYLIIIVSIFYILNPILWKKPITGFTAMVNSRSVLTANQMQSITIDSPFFILNNPVEKFVGFFAQLFVVKPAFQDIANYDSELQLEIVNYNKNLLQAGYGRNILVGAFNFIFFCIGIISEIRNQNSQKFLTFSGLILFILEIFFFIPIPFQRYYIPILPFSMIYISAGIIKSASYTLHVFQKQKSKKIDFS